MLLEDDVLQEVSCSSDHDAKIIDVVKIGGDNFCPPAADDAFVIEIVGLFTDLAGHDSGRDGGTLRPCTQP